MNDQQMENFAGLLSAIRRFERFLIATHVRPDGDAVGSLLALTHMLERLGKTADPFCQDPIPPNYRFLPGSDRIGSRIADPSSYEAAVLVDCADFGRVGGELGEAIRAIGYLVIIDHHLTHVPFGDVFWNRTNSSSTCEMLYDLCLGLGIDIDVPIASSLYTGILTDTGSFRFSNTTRKVLDIASALVGWGAQPSEIAQQVFDSTSAQSLQLLGRVLATLSFHADQRIATAELTQRMFSETSTSPADSEGFINFLRSVGSVQIAMLFREGADGRVHVSMRSKGAVNVAAFAQKYGGGGHQHAAACELPGPLGVLRSRLTEEASWYLT